MIRICLICGKIRAAKKELKNLYYIEMLIRGGPAAVDGCPGGFRIFENYIMS